MALIRLCHTAELEASGPAAANSGRRLQVDAPDGRRLLVIEADGQIHVIEDDCPHQYFPLGDGNLQGTVLTCALHGWRFDLTDGRSLDMPGVCVERWQPVVEDGWISIEFTPLD